MVSTSREDAEQDLGRALARHIGYTSGAYELPRIFAIVEFFQKRTSAYAEEIVADLTARSGGHAPSPGYLADVISFASSFGMIEAVSSRESKLTRYAATELGRSLLGAFALDNQQFLDFYITNVVMMADADFLIPLILYIRDGIDTPLFEYFCAFAKELRARRYEWLRAAFPQAVLFERIASRVGWLKKAKGGTTPYSVDIPTLNTARHHSQPRLGWLSELGLITHDRDAITTFGTDMLRAIVGDQTYFWIAPSPETMATLTLENPIPGASEADLRLSAGSTLPSAAEADSVARDVADMMTRAFAHAKLIYADQASLRLPIAYIQYRSYKDRRRYDWASLLNCVFDENRHTLRRYSAHKGHVGFYKLSAS